MIYTVYQSLPKEVLEVKLPTIWTDGKSRGGKNQRKKRREEKRKRRGREEKRRDERRGEERRREEKREGQREGQRRARVRRKKMQVREKVEKSRFTVVFQWFVAPEGQKVGSLKGRVRSHVAKCEMKNCTPMWREGHFQVKMYKTHQVRTTFGSWDVQKVHAVVARIKFPSQNVQNTSLSDHVWKLRCRKSARRCGAKHRRSRTVHYTNYTTTTITTATHLHYTNYTTLKLQLHPLQLQLQLQLHYATLHPAVVVRWKLQPLQTFQKTQLQPPFGPSVDSLCHPWFTVPPPPCAVLLV